MSSLLFPNSRKVRTHSMRRGVQTLKDCSVDQLGSVITNLCARSISADIKHDMTLVWVNLYRNLMNTTIK